VHLVGFIIRIPYCNFVLKLPAGWSTRFSTEQKTSLGFLKQHDMKIHTAMEVQLHPYLTSLHIQDGPGVNSAFNRFEYQEYFLGVKAAGA
jgi:hypothetical protein